jgi:hypothetical protein
MDDTPSDENAAEYNSVPLTKMLTEAEGKRRGCVEDALTEAEGKRSESVNHSSLSFPLPIPRKDPPTPKGGVHRFFDEFWQAYPLKVAKDKAAAAFAKIDPDESLFAEIMAGLEVAKRSDKWMKDNGQFIAHPTTWLNQRRWEDRPPEALRPPPSRIIYDVVN